MKLTSILAGAAALWFIAAPVTQAHAYVWDHNHNQHEQYYHRHHHHHVRVDRYNREGHRGPGGAIVNDRDPNLYWACDGSGHHCHWARR